MKLNFKNQAIDFADFSIEPDKVLELLSDFITEERKEKTDVVLSNRSSFFVPVLEGLYDRGNISAVMRSAEAFGFYNMHIVETSEDFKESQRVTQGADKWLNVTKWKKTKSCIQSLKDSGYKVFTTHMSEKAVSFDDLDLSQKTAVIFGNEKEGVSQEALDLSDGNVLLPMAGFTQSFNISVAAALSFQRAFLKEPKKIDASEKKMLKALYYLRTINWPQAVLESRLKERL